jgi:hypothetical protein
MHLVSNGLVFRRGKISTISDPTHLAISLGDLERANALIISLKKSNNHIFHQPFANHLLRNWLRLLADHTRERARARRISDPPTSIFIFSCAYLRVSTKNMAPENAKNNINMNLAIDTIHKYVTTTDVQY